MAGVQIARRPPAKPLISLVPMIDVLLILLVFFMVTSTYLDLDMIPVIERGDGAEVATAGGGPGGSVLIRIGADGGAAIAGQSVSLGELTAAIQGRLAEDPTAQILILPSNAAPLQALVTVLDTATLAGATRLRVLRLEAAQ